MTADIVNSSVKGLITIDCIKLNTEEEYDDLFEQLSLKSDDRRRIKIIVQMKVLAISASRGHHPHCF